MTNDLFSLFGMVDTVEQEKQEKAAITKKEQEEKKAQQQKELEKKVAAAKAETGTKEKAAAPKKDSTADAFKPDEETVIRYMGDSLPITDFFSPEELAEGLLVMKKDKDPERQALTAEMLRARMEKEFPELVKNHTEVVFLKKKNLVVIVMKAKPKGANREDWANVRSSLYPLPYSLLNQFISLAKSYAQHDLEVHADIYFMTDTREYVLDIPQQKIQKYEVEVTESASSLANRLSDGIKLLEIHSHHGMAPYPSALDNQSERSPGMFYAIVGYANNFFPDITVRKFVNEQIGHESLELHELFENPFVEMPDYDMDSIEVIIHD